MSMYLSYSDFDTVYKQTPSPKIVLNDLPSETEEDRKILDRLIITTYNQVDVLSNVPTCDCGELTFGFNLGRVCQVCNTPVTRPVESAIGLNVWLRVPNGIKAFINPVVWNMLHQILRVNAASGYSVIEWMLSAQSKVPDKISANSAARLNYLESIGWKRDYNYFIDNYDKFLDILPNLNVTRCNDYLRVLRHYRKETFTQYLPMPTKTLVVIENTAVGSFADLSVTGAVDAARTIVSLSKEGQVFTQAALDRKAVSVMKGLSTFSFETVKENLSKKKGWFRGQLFSSRSHYCARGVITSISRPHYYEELHVPWAQGLELLKIHLVNHLYDEGRGIPLMRAFGLVEGSGKIYNVLLDQLMQKIIAGFPVIYKGNGKPGDIGYLPPMSGVPAIFQRNPSLTRTSAQLLFITRVKTDIEDYTFSLSVLCIRGPNADFDGDEMNCTLLLDKRLAERGYLLRPHYAIHSLSNLGKLNSSLALPDVTNSVLGNWLNAD